MSAPIVHAPVDATTDRDAWLEARRQGIGGSDIAAILGMSPYKTPLEVYLDKRGELDDRAGFRAEWGNRLEDVIARAAVEQINTERAGSGLPDVAMRNRRAILAHRDHPWALCTLDRELLKHERGPGVIECKSTGYWARQQWEDGDTLPDSWHCQTQWQMAVTGRPHGVIAVLWDTANLHLEWVEADPDFQAALLQVGERFWQRVLEGNPPPASAGDTDTLKGLYPSAEPGKRVVLPAEAADLVAERNAAHAAEKAAADRRKTAENRLRQMVGDADEAYLPGEDRPVFTYRQVSPRKPDMKALKEAHPGIVEEFTRPMPHRRFNFPRGD